MSYQDIITIQPDKRNGKPCIRNMRIMVYDILGWMAAGMTRQDILNEYPELTITDLQACLEFAAAR